MNDKITTLNLPKGIYFSSKPVKDTYSKTNKILNDKYDNSNHALLIKSDGSGNYRVIRGGPVNYRGLENFIFGGESRIEGQIDIPLQESHDKIKDKQELLERNFKKINIPEKEIDKEWGKFKETANVIDKSNIGYHNPNPFGITKDKTIQNSNSFIGSVMKANKYNPKDYISNEKLPGIETNLFDKPRLVKPIGDENPQMHSEIYKIQKYQEKALKYQVKHKEISDKIKETEDKEKLKKEEFEKNQTKISWVEKSTFKQTLKPLSENEVRELMKSEAYNNKYNPNYEETQKKVRQAWENLYPDDDRNENPQNYYIWKAVGDDRTRSSHLERDGEVFSWDNPPEGGHPGESYNCRCEAIPYETPKEKICYIDDKINHIVSKDNSLIENIKNWNEERKRVNKIKVSDEKKHQYMSCLAGKGGDSMALFGLVAGIGKEVLDFGYKTTNSEQRKRYGGYWGVGFDGGKDMRNNLIGIKRSYIDGKPCINLLEDSF